MDGCVGIDECRWLMMGGCVCDRWLVCRWMDGGGIDVCVSLVLGGVLGW